MNLNQIIRAATPVLSNNKALPALPAWKARSFWLTIITAGVALANTMGVDLLGILSEMGLGSSPNAVIDNASRGVGAVQQLIPIATGIWAWVERRAPNFRLTWWRRD